MIATGTDALNLTASVQTEENTHVPESSADISSIEGPPFSKGIISVGPIGKTPEYPLPPEPVEDEPFQISIGDIIFPKSPVSQPEEMRQAKTVRGESQKPHIADMWHALIYTDDGKWWTAAQDESFSLSFEFVYNTIIRQEIDLLTQFGDSVDQIDTTQNFEIGYIFENTYVKLGEGETPESEEPMLCEFMFTAPTDGDYLFVLLDQSKYEIGINKAKIERP